MKVKWRNNKNLKPDVILRKIDSIKTINSDKTVSYSGFDYHNVMATLQSMIEFPEKTNGLEQESIVSIAVSNIAKNSDLDAKKVIDEINLIVKNKLATREFKFHVLTSISLKPPPSEKRIRVESSLIRLLRSDYPKKYVSRNDVIKTSMPKLLDSTPREYTKIIVSLKEKSEKGAITSALRVLDIQRAIWSLFSNSSMEIIGDEWQPINKIRLGSAHTIHKENGKAITEILWYEPNFVKAKIFEHSEPDVLEKNSKWAIKQIEKLSYRDIVKDALLRYVRALDERDQNVALIKLWGALEALTTPSESNYDLITRRASFFFSEKDYHKQILEHLRDYRNRSVHSGDQSEKAKSNCYQLQFYFYFYHLILFHLSSAGDFTSLEEVNNYLDLPLNIDILKNKKRLIDKAIKFVQ